MQITINARVKHIVCTMCVAKKLSSDPRTFDSNAWVEEQLCDSHDRRKALKDHDLKHPVWLLIKPAR